MILTESVVNRYWNKVVRKPDNSCWDWNGSKSKGYGQLSTGKNKSPVKAHRISWLIHHGEIPVGMEICHTCDNPNCSNPSHLFLGTHKENMTDAFRKGRIDNFVHYSGENNPSAKLTNEQVKQIRNLYVTSKHSHKSLSDLFGVSCSTIQKIVRNQVYVDKDFCPIDGNKKPRPSRKLFDEAKVRKISLAYKNGASSIKLARKFNTNKTTILKIIHGKY